MNASLNWKHAALMALPPLLWAGNAVVGRLVAPLVPPLTLNALRWSLAFLVLLPLAHGALRAGSGLWTHWRRYALLGLLSVGLYNALQYMALRTSTPMNVTLVGSSMPMFMLALGTLFFGQRARAAQVAGALLSMAGVMVVLTQGDPRRLGEVHFVAGDLFMLLATATWAWYSWLLTQREADPSDLRGDWAAFLMAQVAPGLAWSILFTGVEWTVGHPAPVQWGWPLALALAYIALGPALLAYRVWGMGVQRMGPNMAAFFLNLTPLFAALLSTAFLGEVPHAYHAAAFALIAGGIWVSSRPKA